MHQLLTYYSSNVKAHATKYRSPKTGTNICDFGWKKKNIANRELAMSQWTQVNRKKYWFVLWKNLSETFELKKIDAFKALKISATIYDWHFFFDKIKPIWENRIIR